MKNLLLHSRYWLLATGFLLAALALWSCNSQTAATKALVEHQEQLKTIDEDTIQHYLVRNKLLSKSRRTSSGLYVVDSVAGQGTPVTAGKQVRVKYIGRFLSNGAHPSSTGYPASYGNPSFPAGSIFRNSADNRSTCGCTVFTAGSIASGENNAGLNEGLLLMRQGERKLLLVPSRLAYGSAGQTNANGKTVIPADATLLFDVEIIEVL